MDGLTKLLEVGLAGAAMNIIVIRGQIFKGLRQYLKRNSRFFGELIYCPLCFGTWTGIILSLVVDLRIFGTGIWIPLNWFLSALAATSLIVVFSLLVFVAMHKISIPSGELD